jgi:predicted peptidase
MRKLLITTLMTAASFASAAPEPREWKAPDGTVVRYRWSEPEKIEAGKTYPLVLFLHGSGERGEDNTAQLKHGVRPLIHHAEKIGNPVFLIAPQCPKDRWWSPPTGDRTALGSAGQPNALLDHLLTLITEIQQSHPVDKRRFHVTGISMGGFGTWDLLGRAPERIASAVPICGGGDPSLAATFKAVPVWAFHGDADAVVPVAATRQMIEAMEKSGGKPKVTYYPGVGHDSWTQTYEDPEVVRWLLNARAAQ